MRPSTASSKINSHDRIKMVNSHRHSMVVSGTRVEDMSVHSTSSMSVYSVPDERTEASAEGGHYSALGSPVPGNSAESSSHVGSEATAEDPREESGEEAVDHYINTGRNKVRSPVVEGSVVYSAGNSICPES